MLAGPFFVPITRKLEPVFQEKAKEVTELFDRIIAAGNGRSGSVNVCDAFTRFTLDIVGKTVLGQDMSNLKSTTFTGEEQQDAKTGGYRLSQAYESIFSQGPVGNALLFANGFVPIRWLPLKANRDFLYGTSWLNDVLRDLIRKRTEEITANNKTGKLNTIESRDLLTFIVEESMPGGPAEGIAEENFLGHLLQLMAAGVDTGSNILAWSALIFATQQDVQDTLRAEISFRVYPPATTIHRQAVTDLVIDGVAVRKDKPIDVVFSMAMLNPLVWGDDADKVDPSRWGRLTEAQQSPHAFSAFSNGPRICAGRTLPWSRSRPSLSR
ncbi:hypothetical protein LQW54_012375 [Pestalotiopsis sp. IQ-011]